MKNRRTAHSAALAIILKKKNYIMIFVLALTIMSCGQNSFEKELNGKWYCLENDGLTRLDFYPDSLIFTEISSQNVQWQATKSTFEFEIIQQQPNLSNTNESEKLLTEYRLSNTKDTLFCKVNIPVGVNDFKFIRAKNYISFLGKKNGIELNLPTDLKVEHIKLDSEYGLKIFIKQNNSSLNGITDFGHSLDSLNTDLIEFKKNIKPVNKLHLAKLKHETHFRVFADKSISNEKIETFLQKINNTEIDKAYRIYESEEYDNLDYLRGKRIKTIANNTYSK